MERVIRKVLLWPQSDPSSEEEEEKLELGPFKGNGESRAEDNASLGRSGQPDWELPAFINAREYLLQTGSGDERQ